ncbi:MAG: hypothetical protein QM808_00310 [Steroidobacteraceae bacterium]
MNNWLNTRLIVLLCAALPLHAWAADSQSKPRNDDLRSLKSFRTFAPPLPEGAQPTADPRDFNGTYNINPIAQVLEPVQGGDKNTDGTLIPPFTKAGADIFWKRIERFNAGKQIPEPSVMCEPSWKTRTSSLMEFTQTDGVLAIFFAEHHITRLIHMNTAHPRNLKPSYMGHSIGHWEGNTLVIDTLGFNDRGWFDFAGTPQSPTTHLVERMTKQPNGDIRDEMTYSDTKLFRHPFVTVEMYRRVSPDWEILDEQICEENERNFGLEVQP